MIVVPPPPPLSDRVIIAGSRGITTLSLVSEAVSASGFTPREVVSGGARGVDLLGEQWARTLGIPVRQFLADRGRYGRTAGRLRNTQMAEYADCLIAIWDGRSPGTEHMINAMSYRRKPFYVHQVAA